MARTLKIGVFNIVTHPHSPENYARLFKAAFKLEESIKIRGETHATIGSMIEHPTFKGCLTGDIFSYLQLDKTAGWFNIVKGEQANKNETDGLVIPDELKPHCKRIRYLFFTHQHLFIYVVQFGKDAGISPNSMQVYLTILLAEANKKNNTTSSIKVTPVQDSASIDFILNECDIDRLEIILHRPNGDTPVNLENSINQEQDEQNIVETDVKYTAKRGMNINPNAKTKAAMKMATTNGAVKASGRNRKTKKRIKVDTRKKPKIEIVQITKKRSFLEVLHEHALKIVSYVASL